MPSNILNADVGFPEFSEEQNDKEKIDQIVNYLYMLLEQLRYSLYNLDADNFNDKGLEELQLLITEPIYAHLEDDEGRIAELALTAQGLSADMYGENGRVATIIATANALSESLYDPQTGAITQLQATASGLYTEVWGSEPGTSSIISQTANAITQKVWSDDISTQISAFAGGLTLAVTNGSDSSTIALKSGQTQISAGTITLTGMVRFSSFNVPAYSSTETYNAGDQASYSGYIYTCTENNTRNKTPSNTSSYWVRSASSTFINGSHIQTSSVSADCVTTGTLTSNAGAVWLRGFLAVKDSDGTNRGLLGGFGSAQGNSCVALVGATNLTGGWVIAASSGAKLGISYNNAQVYVGEDASSYSVLIRSGNTYAIQFKDEAFRPYTGSNVPTLGSGSYPWSNVYASTGPWAGSDRNEKTDISYDNDTYLEVFDKLQPATYKRIDGTSGRTHFGFIAQDVEEAILDAGMTTQDYACIAKFEKEDSEGYGYALRYEEFIALAVLKIKKLEARIAALEGE